VSSLPRLDVSQRPATIIYAVCPRFAVAWTRRSLSYTMSSGYPDVLVSSIVHWVRTPWLVLRRSRGVTRQEAERSRPITSQLQFDVTSEATSGYYSEYWIGLPISKHAYNYKKAVLSQRWPRDTRYISRSWGDIAIQNYPRWRHYLEFIWIENSAIRSAVPENPTL